MIQKGCLLERVLNRAFTVYKMMNFHSFQDGEHDTIAKDVSKKTYLPSMLLFHEEIMQTMNVKPTIPKTEPDPRDIIMQNIAKDAEALLPVTDSVATAPPIYLTFAFYARNMLENLKFWK